MIERQRRSAEFSKAAVPRLPWSPGKVPHSGEECERLTGRALFHVCATGDATGDGGAAGTAVQHGHYPTSAALVMFSNKPDLISVTATRAIHPSPFSLIHPGRKKKKEKKAHTSGNAHRSLSLANDSNPVQVFVPTPGAPHLTSPHLTQGPHAASLQPGPSGGTKHQHQHQHQQEHQNPSTLREGREEMTEYCTSSNLQGFFFFFLPYTQEVVPCMNVKILTVCYHVI